MPTCARWWNDSGKQKEPSQPLWDMQPIESRNGFAETKGQKSFRRAQ